MNIPRIALVLLASLIFFGCSDPTGGDRKQDLLTKAKAGDAEAQFNLGDRYCHGDGVPQDDKEAVKWYRKAAEQGYAFAQHNLGVMYANGRGVPEDDKEAVKWFRKAAEQGYAFAQFNLGVRYDTGRGVPRE